MLLHEQRDALWFSLRELAENPADGRLAEARGITRVRCADLENEVGQPRVLTRAARRELHERDGGGAALPKVLGVAPRGDLLGSSATVVHTPEKPCQHLHAVPVAGAPLGDVAALERFGQNGNVVAAQLREKTFRQEEDPRELLLGVRLCEERQRQV